MVGKKMISFGLLWEIRMFGRLVYFWVMMWYSRKTVVCLENGDEVGVMRNLVWVEYRKEIVTYLFSLVL